MLVKVANGVVPFPCKLLWTKAKAEIWIKHCNSWLPFIWATLECSILVSRNFDADVDKQLPLDIRFALPKVSWDIFKSNKKTSNLLRRVVWKRYFCRVYMGCVVNVQAWSTTTQGSWCEITNVCCFESYLDCVCVPSKLKHKYPSQLKPICKWPGRPNLGPHFDNRLSIIIQLRWKSPLVFIQNSKWLLQSCVLLACVKLCSSRITSKMERDPLWFPLNLNYNSKIIK